MPLYSPRLPAVVTRADLAWLVTPTYAEALSVEDDEAHERLERALLQAELVDDLLWGSPRPCPPSRAPAPLRISWSTGSPRPSTPAAAR